MSNILTVSEVAESLRVSERTVRNWLESGKLIGFKFGQVYRIKQEDLDTFINNSIVKEKENEND